MWREYLRIALKVLRTHKFRSSLTVLSITMGAFSIVLMTSLADSGLTTMFRDIEDLGGGRILAVGPKQAERAENKQASYSRGITVEDRDHLYAALPHTLERAMFSSLDRKDVISDGGQMARTDLVAGDSGLVDLCKMKLAKGRNFTEEENQKHAKVCLIGHKTAQQLFDGDAIGHTLNVDGLRCRVIGQLIDQDRWGMNFGFDWLEFVLVPLETLADLDPAVKKTAWIQFKTDDQQSNEIVKRIMNALLIERHHGVDDFEIFDFAKIMDKFNNMFSIMKAIVGLIAGIALLVGGVGVMNMMLVSVSERVREIGIRKALGASPRDIGTQFIYEAMVLSGSGGLVGIIGGVLSATGAALLIRHFKPTWVLVISHGAVGWALGVSVGVGLIFGYFPARRASKLDAILAIRT